MDDYVIVFTVFSLLWAFPLGLIVHLHDLFHYFVLNRRSLKHLFLFSVVSDVKWIGRFVCNVSIPLTDDCHRVQCKSVHRMLCRHMLTL
jgi:hypothetical protein